MGASFRVNAVKLVYMGRLTMRGGPKVQAYVVKIRLGTE
jgi:hypothetical protein